MNSIKTPSGAHAALSALADAGVQVCFANPGTTELDVVRAFEHEPRMRYVLGLQENVCTGAADGYGRMTGTPSATLLHLGPGFANGIANLHNARRAGTPIVNLIGDHTSWHLPYDAPLTSDIDALAGSVSRWVHRTSGPDDCAPAAREAVQQSMAEGGGSATLILPADHQADATSTALAAGSGEGGAVTAPLAKAPHTALVASWAAQLRASRRTVFLLGGGGELTGLGAQAQALVAQLCQALGAQAFAETFPARAERGQGLPAYDRLPYFPEPARAVLDEADVVVLVGALPPITYFGYEGHPSLLVPEARQLHLAAPRQDAVTPLKVLIDALGIHEPAPAAAPLPLPEAATGTLTPAKIAATLVRALPERAIVSVEGGTCGYPFYAASAAAPRHTTLTNTGGAIGQGLPVAMGAAIACPDRRVIALLSDGSTQYTIQTLWSLAHENLDVVILIAANHQYAILRNELRRTSPTLGEQAQAITALDRPRIDWVGLARSYGVNALLAETAEELAFALSEALKAKGPHLIEMAL
jgi:acetolactate synthase-1/2/3 large subunit